MSESKTSARNAPCTISWEVINHGLDNWRPLEGIKSGSTWTHVRREIIDTIKLNYVLYSLGVALEKNDLEGAQKEFEIMESKLGDASEFFAHQVKYKIYQDLELHILYKSYFMKEEKMRLPLIDFIQSWKSDFPGKFMLTSLNEATIELIQVDLSLGVSAGLKKARKLQATVIDILCDRGEEADIFTLYGFLLKKCSPDSILYDVYNKFMGDFVDTSSTIEEKKEVCEKYILHLGTFAENYDVCLNLSDRADSLFYKKMIEFYSEIHNAKNAAEATKICQKHTQRLSENAKLYDECINLAKEENERRERHPNKKRKERPWT